MICLAASSWKGMVVLGVPTPKEFKMDTKK